MHYSGQLSLQGSGQVAGETASGHKRDLEQGSSKQAEYAGGKLSVQEELRPPGQAASGAAEATTANSCNPGQQQHQCQCHKKSRCCQTKKGLRCLKVTILKRKQGHNCPLSDKTF